jgi:Uncharacterised nucleotidyltransferase
VNSFAPGVAAWGLPNAHRFPREPLGDAEFGQLLGSSEQQRVLGLLGASVGNGAFPVTDAQRAQLEERWQGWLAHAVRVERLLTRISDALAARDIQPIVLKGVALAHTTYPDPAWRVFGDVDLLIESSRFSYAANAVVEGLDGTRALPELRPGFDDRFGREILVRVGSIEVDIHRTFVDGALGLTITLPDMFADPTRFGLDGRTFTALAPEVRLLHAAYAAVLSDWPPRLVASRDLAQSVLHVNPDPNRVIELAHRWRAEAVLTAALRLAWGSLRITERHALIEWADRYRTSMLDRALLASYRGRARGYTSQAATLLVLPGYRDRWAYTRALAKPSAEYRAARGLGRFGLLGLGATKATRG